MVSPHLLHVVESYSTSLYTKKNQADVIVNNRYGDDRPRFIIESTNKKPKWLHIVLAQGPILETDLDDDPKGSELVIVWWSEMEPDTSRVLSAVDWEKHAKNY